MTTPSGVEVNRPTQPPGGPGETGADIIENNDNNGGGAGRQNGGNHAGHVVFSLPALVMSVVMAIVWW